MFHGVIWVLECLWEISERSYGNVLKGDVIAKDTSNSYILSDDRLICTIGINDLVVVSNMMRF